jgi:hypothetical protein
MSITNAPVPIKLGDKEYLVSGLNDQSLVALDEYVKFLHMTSVSEAVATLPVHQQQAAITAAANICSSLSFMSAEGARIMRSVNGVSRILWQGIVQNDPKVTHEEIRALMFKRENIIKANKVFEELNIKPLQEVQRAGKLQKGPRRKPVKRTAKKSTKRS